MPEITETRLPGVGACHDFPTRSGTRIGVVKRSTARRELVVYDADDPDSVSQSVDLTPEEAQTLSELLGGQTLREAANEGTGLIHGLALDWITVPESFAPTTIGDLGIRTRTGASIVAVVTGDETDPAPGPEFTLQARDVAVVVGTPDAVSAVVGLLGA